MMTKNYLLLLSLLLSTFTFVYGQSPYDVLVVERPVNSFGGARMCLNDAGTIDGFSPITGQSNDGIPDTIYLCFNDQISVDHSGNAMIPNDPDLNTDAGVGYWITNCEPSIDGENRADLSGDFCNITDPAPAGGIYLYSSGALFGDETFFNDGGLQGFFSAGEPAIYWFSPITFDAYNSGTMNAVYEGAPEDECINVSIDEAFAIAFLNEITVTEIDNNGVTGCVGSFRVRGGLPELDSNEAYTSVIMYNQADPSIQGEILDNTSIHDEVIDFYVPQPGTYIIEIEDGKSCGAMVTVDMGACQDVTINLPLSNAMPGENICLEVTVEDFVNVGSMQGIFTYDPTVLTWTGVQDFNPNMPDLDAGLFNENVGDEGNIRYSWLDLDTQDGLVTLPNGDAIFDLCFQVIGDLGDCSPLGFVGGATIPLEIGGDSNEPNPFYGVVINDGKVNISNNPFFVFVSQDSLTCPSDDDGAFTVTVDDGLAPYQYSWNTIPVSGPNQGPFVIANDGDSDTVNGLGAGLYQITVTDGMAQMVVDTIEVLAGAELGASILFESPLCFGGADATVRVGVFLNSVEVMNPGPEITYVWNVPNVTDQILNNQTAGFYAATITDASGCTAEASATVTQPAQLRILANNTFITDASCTGGGDGEITVAAEGGTNIANGNYTYVWDSGLMINDVSTTLTNLNPGQYCVTVTDDNNCEFTDCYTVGAVKVLSITDVITDVLCNGDANGEIFITGSTSGAPADEPYAFSWSANAPVASNTNTTSELTGLTADTYFVTMTDASLAGCEVTDSFIVNQPEPLVVSLLEQINETCLVGNDGSIISEVTGGTFPYNYTWSHDATLMDSLATGLSMDNYVLDVVDMNGCTGQLDVDILAPTPPSILQLDDDSVSCPDDTDGVLTVVSQVGGAPIDNFTWDNGLMGATITNLGPGQYIVTVTAADACTAIDTAFVIAPLPIVLDSFNVRLPSCPGDNNGQITVFANGGTPPYNYEWSTDPGVITTINPKAGLLAGDYSVTISDDSGCDPIIQQITVVDPPSIVGDFSNLMDTTCPDDNTCDGQATFTAAYSDGTTGLFNFTWLSSGEIENGVNPSTATQLCEGIQQLNVGDGVCGESFEFTIGAPDPIVVDVEVENTSCNGDMDGTIGLTPEGGTAPYDYFWTHSGEMTDMIANLGAGDYTAIITDANGCNREQIVQVGEPDVLQLTIDPNTSTDFVSCAGDEDGIMAVTVNTSANINPIGPAPYTWSDGIAPASAATATGLVSGTYSVTVTDIKGCQDEVSFTIMEPTPITLVLDPIEDPACFGDATFITIDTVFGGAGNVFEEFTFMVDNNGLNFPVTQPATVFAGDHVISVEDVNGCIEEEMVTIVQPAQVVVTLPNEIVVELGDSSVQLNPLVTPGGMYNYQWSPADYLSSDTIASPFVFPEASLEYSLTVTNENGCTSIETIFVELDANRNVYIPNIFSPNGDGYNDIFRVYTCLGVREINSARIFDRWGGIVYEGTNLSPSCLDGVKLWDGLKNGNKLNPDVYVYLIEVTFLDGVVLTYRGDVAIIR